MKGRFTAFLMALSFMLTWFPYSSASVEWDVARTLKIEKRPLDVAISVNGRWIFVLTGDGEISVYSQAGTLEGTIPVSESIDGIKAGPSEDILILTSREDRTIQVLTLDFVQQFNLSDSPFKGPVDAPVVIAVFTDFQ